MTSTPTQRTFPIKKAASPCEYNDEESDNSRMISTSQGDETCKGCGRSFEEVQLWIEMSPGEKRSIWHRITTEGNSWRFNRYAERAAENRRWAKAAADAQVPLDLKP